MLVGVDYRLRIHGPGDYDSAFRIESQQIVDAVAFGLELEQHVRLFGEKRHHLAREADIRIQYQAIGNLSGSDTKK